MAPRERIPRAPATRVPPRFISGDLPPHLLCEAALAALHRFLPRNEDPSADAYAGDEFRMYEFKVRRCPRGRSHDWTECPYAHQGEKARRRDPRLFHYSGSPCPDFRRGSGCRLGDACDLAHGVFETWLHPARYRTQPCKDGVACPRRVCFFAHSAEQLRVVVPTSPKDGGAATSSPTSTLAPAPFSPPSCGSSPPLSPVEAAMRALQLSKVRPGLPFGRAPLSEGRRTAADWSVDVRAELLESWRNEEPEEEAPDLEWVSELVED